MASGYAKYDVFLSSRGADTLDNFTGQLYTALCQQEIRTFIDSEFDRKDEVTPVTLQKIEQSKVALIIFSENYMNSTCCLDELVKILECKTTMGLVVLPVFYSVNPSDMYGIARRFDDVSVENSLKQDRDRLQKWRYALMEAANLSGWDSTTRSQSDLVDGIVKDILRKLSHMSSSNTERLFGIESHIEKLRGMLSTGSTGVSILGIWGMGGIGKTTIAEAIFNHISSEFDCCCFLANVREESENRGLVRLRNELFSRLLHKQNVYMGTPIIGNNFVINRLRRKKVLIVLDDVNNSKQLSYLVGEHNWFGPGSRIIITTRDKHLLQDGVDKTYEVKGLAYKYALQLFSWKAFEQDHPVEDNMKISNRILKYAKGVPLALKVLGSSLHNRSKKDWERTLSKLERTPNMEIQNVLRISYDELEDEEKDIFLDIACFFKRETRDDVTKILDGCGFSSDIGISVLIDKSLVSISNDRISMHDLVQEMGREIVRQESPEEPGNRSRLLQHKDIYHVLTNETGTDAVEGLSLDMSKLREVHLNPDAFAKMHRLRFLRFYSSLYRGGSESEDLTFPDLYGSRYYRDYKEGSNLQISEGLKSLSSQLRFLQWHMYPLRSLPSNFHPENLVELNMPHSKVEHLWDGVQNLVKLKRINLRYSHHLVEAPDLSQALDLERMDFRGCTSLGEVPSSIRYLDKLDILELGGCKNLRRLPSNICLKSLRILTLSNCSSLSIFPEISWNLKELNLDGTAIEEVPSSIECFSRLVTLNMKNCARLKNLPDCICKLKSLQKLFLGGTSIKELPTSIESMSGLTLLYLQKCKNLVRLPNGVCNLKSLINLSLFGCSKLEKLPADLGKLHRLFEFEADETAINQLPSSVTFLNNLTELSFCGCKGEYSVNFPLPPLSGLSSLRNLYLRDRDLLEFPADITCLTLLETLGLSGNNFKSIPASIKNLVELRRLDLSYCKRLQSIPELPPHLIHFGAHGCTSLVTVSRTLAVLPKWLDSLNRHMFLFTNCSSLGQNALRNILADAKQKIQLMATACQKLYWGFYPTPSVTFGFPGSDIPEWFSYRSIGTSVTVRLPQQWHHPKFLGFAFCIVVAFKESYDGSFFSIRCESDYQDLYCHLDGWCCGQKGKIGLSFNGSDHLFMLYDHSLYLMAVKGEEGENDTSFRFYAVDKDKKPLHCCTVKKCGVRLLFPYEDKSCSSALIQGCTSFENFDVINEDNGKPMEEEGTFTKRYRDDESCNRAESSGCEIGSSSEGRDPKRIKESSESNAGDPTRA